MPFIDITKIEGIRINEPYGRLIKIIMAPDTQDDVKDISITMGIIDPHSQNDLHIHEGQTEILYIVNGFGKAIIGDQTYEIKHDSLIIALPGLVHQQINLSDETMQMFAIWTPAVTGKEVLERSLKASGQLDK
jgi:mannose-6-phosphate isomerase-like protein (cupin superfamily)